MTPILSILTPAVPKRMLQLAGLCEEISKQTDSLPVEHLCFIDNKMRTVGEKRDALLRMARGKYVAFVDDDDWIAPTYIHDLIQAAHLDPDVITFRQEATVNGQCREIEFKMGNPNEAFDKNDGFYMVKRNAWHVCAWKRTRAVLSSFPANNYGEDWAYASKLCAIPNLREQHIAKVLHFYRHDSKTTEAPPP